MPVVDGAGRVNNYFFLFEPSLPIFIKETSMSFNITATCREVKKILVAKLRSIIKQEALNAIFSKKALLALMVK